MKKINYKSDKGVTLTALVITVTAMIILTSVILYNAKSDLVVNKLQTMKMDIENIRGKVETYYAKYGALPVLETPYTNLTDLSNSNILGVNDGEEFYVIDLSLLENLTLTYGKDFPDIKANEASMNNYKDVYIINGKSHNIFYVQGVIINGKAHYTDYGIKDVDSEKLVLAPIQDGTSILPGNISTSNSAKYVDVNKDEAYIPKGFQIIEGLDNISEGLVISDDKGNEFVWIPVKNMNDFKRQEGYYDGTIESRWNKTYEAGSEVNPNFVENASVIKEASRMYKSVEKHGGFYIGRYEAGMTETRDVNSVDIIKPMSKKNLNPYNFIGWSNSTNMDVVSGGAVEAARSMYLNDEAYGVTSTLCYDVQWDAVMNFIDNNYITNASIKKPACDSNSFLFNSIDKGNYAPNGSVVKATGSSENFKNKNIYDLAGNVWEWTMESFYADKRTKRGGDYKNYGNVNPVTNHGDNIPNGKKDSLGFRVALFIDDKEDLLPSTTDTKPFLPDGAIQVSGTNLDNGLTIQDDKGNEWVWIEVPKSIYTNNIYNNNGANKPSGPTDYGNIEAVMNKYTETYKNKNIIRFKFTDTYYSKEQHGFQSSTEYNNHKNKMLKSVYENGGFYIGKYEAGTETLRNTPEAPLTTPVIKEGVYPYNYVTCLQAQQKATELSTGGKTSSLMFGVQWDLILKHIETKGGKTVTELNNDSSSWGNCYNSTFTINKGRYAVYNMDTYQLGDFSKEQNNIEKPGDASWLLTTGASNENSTLNIYDLAGNVWEWTLEFSSAISDPCTDRGGSFEFTGSYFPSSTRYGRNTDKSWKSTGFRPALY